MTTRYPKQFASNPQANELLKLIAEHDAQVYGDKPNESWTFRRLVQDEAKRIGITPHALRNKKRRATAAATAHD